MPEVCAHCGQQLPRDDAQFCNNCGMLVPSHPFSPQSLAAPKKASALSDQPEQKPDVLREQIAQQSPIKTSSSSAARKRLTSSPDLREIVAAAKHNLAQDEALLAENQYSPASPARKDQPEKSAQDKSMAWPMPVTHISIADRAASLDDDERQEPAAPPDTEPPESLWPSQEESPALDALEDEIEDQPTIVQPIAGAIDEMPTQAMQSLPGGTVDQGGDQGDIEDLPTQAMSALSNDVSDVASIDTTAMPRLQNALPAAQPLLPPLPEPQPDIPAMNVQSSLPGVVSWHGNEPVRAATPAPSSQPPASVSLHGMFENAPANSFVPAAPRRKSKFPLILLIVVVVLALTGGGIWIFMTNPFSVAPVTQPHIGFQDSGLGVSLLYPNGWTARVDRAKAVAHLYDSSRTTMVDIAVSDGAGTDPTKFLQQFQSQLGMTGARSGETVTFGGGQWQQVQGVVALSGASYTCTIFSTVHNGRIVTVTQYAPQSTYADNEKDIFAPLRASFRFL